jgi:hypothetical protein
VLAYCRLVAADPLVLLVVAAMAGDLGAMKSASETLRKSASE